MLIKIFLNYLFGYINITIEGFFIERFINNCKSKKIFLWNIKRSTSTILNAKISVKDFKKIRSIIKKTKCRIKINSKKGLPFIFNRYKKRKIFIFLIIPILLIIYISSMYIWNVEIVGNNNIDEDELINQLKEYGLDIGKLKKSIDTKSVINNIRLERNDISWMEINLKGTNAIVNIVEADEKPEIVKDQEYCNIVSDKRGVITKITANKGTALVKEGDIVNVGTELIAGYMEGKYTERRYVHAQGEVQAKVWYTKRKYSEFTREVTTQTGNYKNRYRISINNFEINLYKSIPNFEKYDTISENKKIKIFSNFYMPLTIIKDTYIETKTETITYGKTELQNILISELEEEFKKEELDETKITNKIVNVYQTNDSGIEVEMTYEVLETIGTEEKLNF